MSDQIGLSHSEPPGAVPCQLCGLNDLCTIAGPDEVLPEEIGQLILIRRQVRRGEALFRAGSTFDSIYSVKSGSVKLYQPDTNDPENGRIVDFQVPGELFGFEGMATGIHPYTAKAMEPTRICIIRWDRLERLGSRLPYFQSVMMEVMAQSVHQYQRTSLLIGTQNGEQRLAAFFYNLSNRFRARGLSGSSFRLPVPRCDIASYLGLAVETVSRLMRRFEEIELLSGKGRQITIINLERLDQLARGVEQEQKGEQRSG
jgi:CRP/FNR family transcriptional regulator